MWRCNFFGVCTCENALLGVASLDVYSLWFPSTTTCSHMLPPGALSDTKSQRSKISAKSSERHC